jgi:DNA-binding IclR family transcriptional regulator
MTVELTKGEKRVLKALESFAKRQQTPTYPALAGELGCSISTLWQYFAQLERKGCVAQGQLKVVVECRVVTSAGRRALRRAA